jgi:hypothetical protein
VQRGRPQPSHRDHSFVFIGIGVGGSYQISTSGSSPDLGPGAQRGVVLAHRQVGMIADRPDARDAELAERVRGDGPNPQIPWVIPPGVKPGDRGDHDKGVHGPQMDLIWKAPPEKTTEDTRPPV